MKPIVYALVLLLSFGCAAPQQLGVPESIPGLQRADWVAWQKKEDAKAFAVRYGWIDIADGVDQKEAWAISDLYFQSTGWMCGSVFEPKKIGRKWRSEFALGYEGRRSKPIWVDALTGAVWQDGGDRIDDIVALLRVDPRPEKPNQSPEPTSGLRPAAAHL
jgi:hypothetical protein